MDNVKIIENGQENNVSLICYFSSNNSNYIFYTKNESVQNGLIKMYVAKDNNDAITDDEWTNLKKIMQAIIMNNTDVTFNKYSSNVTVSQSRAIALNQGNINTMSTVYKNSNLVDLNSNETNMDLLKENFEIPSIEPIENVTPIQNENSTQIDKPVISAIPENQNTLDMESTPVNLEPDVQNETLTINNVTNPMDSGFKVSDEPNIFDAPSTDNTSASNTVEAPMIPEVNSTDNKSISVDIAPGQVDSKPTESTNKQVELNNRKIKLLEELVSIYREENDMLLNDDALEKTASNLFNNNGSIGNF